jgi:predicted enzyme related to lactoylglutathione lyase
MVFIPVSDMQRSIQWYSQLLDLPVTAPSHGGKIYDLPMEGETGVILDAHKPVTNSSQPLCFFWTADIQATLALLQAHNVDILGEMADIGSVTTLTFRDPDGNLLMVCEAR